MTAVSSSAGLCRARTRSRWQIDRSFAERERQDAGTPGITTCTNRSNPIRGSASRLGRHWIKSGGGVLAADAPMLSFEMFECLPRDLLELVAGYLGEPR